MSGRRQRIGVLLGQNRCRWPRECRQDAADCTVGVGRGLGCTGGFALLASHFRASFVRGIEWSNRIYSSRQPRWTKGDCVIGLQRSTVRMPLALLDLNCSPTHVQHLQVLACSRRCSAAGKRDRQCRLEGVRESHCQSGHRRVLSKTRDLYRLDFDLGRGATCRGRRLWDGLGSRDGLARRLVAVGAAPLFGVRACLAHATRAHPN